MDNDKDILNTAEIPYEVRMKYIIEAYRKDKERWAKLEAYNMTGDSPSSYSLTAGTGTVDTLP